MTVANNHALDFGIEALQQEIEILDSCGIAHCGGGNNQIASAEPAFIKAGEYWVAIIGIDTETAPAAASINHGGINYAPESVLIKTVAGSVAIAKKHADFIIFSPHWGNNWAENPSQFRQELARKIIDLGADAILGHSAHIIQGIEIYKERPIIYDMGTLLFDRVEQNRIRYSALFGLEIGQNGASQLTISPIRLRSAQASIADENDSKSVRDLIIRLSQEIDPHIKFEQSGERLTIQLKPQNRRHYELIKPERLLPYDKKDLSLVPGYYMSQRSTVVYDTIPSDFQWQTPVIIHEGLHLLGTRIAHKVRPGYGFLCEVFFRAAKPVAGRWEARITAWDEKSQKQFEYTNPVADGAWPQNHWRMEDIVGDRIIVRPPKNLPEGIYLLTWCLVDRQTGSAMPINSSCNKLFEGAIVIGELHIDNLAPPGPAGIPFTYQPLNYKHKFHMKPLSYLKKFDKRQLFRFFVDGRFQKKYRGWRGYEEHEEGSASGMLRGYRLVLENFDLSKGLNLEYIKRLHKACMSDVKVKIRTIQPGEFRYLDTGFLFRDGNLTEAGILDVFKQRKGDGTPLFKDKELQKTTEEIAPSDIFEALKQYKKLRYRPWYPLLSVEQKSVLETKNPPEEFARIKHWVQNQIEQRAQSIVDHFNNCIRSARTDQQQLETISKLVRDMELLHPFPDGNCRTLQTLMNHLLMYLKMPPSILYDPNLDAQYSVEEYAAEIQRGIECTLRLLDNPDAEEYDYRITDASAEDISEFMEMAKELTTKIEDFADMDYNAIASEPTQATVKDPIYLTPDILARATGGQWLNCDPSLRFECAACVAPNSKIFPKGALYFPSPLKDWEVDGKSLVEVIENLYSKGAFAVVLDDADCAKQLNKPVLLVKKISKALDDAAIAARKGVNCKTVLITGTVGKTGAKIQLHHCLSKQTKTHAVLNSANTRGPVLSSLTNLKPDDRVELNEMSLAGGGASMGVGRSRIVQPTICFYTSVGPNHMDNHITVENLIEAKAAAVEGLVKDGICIINSSSDYFDQILSAVRRRRSDIPILTFGTNTTDNARILDTHFNEKTLWWNVRADIYGEIISYCLPLAQQHAPIISAGVLLTVKMLGYNVQQAAQDYQDLKPFETMGQFYRIAINEGHFLSTTNPEEVVFKA